MAGEQYREFIWGGYTCCYEGKYMRDVISLVEKSTKTQFSFSFLYFIKKFYFIELQLIYYVVLISTVQQSDSVLYIYIYIYTFFSIMIYHRMLNIVPCDIQQYLVVNLFYT